MFNYPGKSKKGELSIFPNNFVVLSHCLHMMPRQKSAAAAVDKANLKVSMYVIYTYHVCIFIFNFFMLFDDLMP